MTIRIILSHAITLWVLLLCPVAGGAGPQCQDDTDCNDGDDCNGVETCDTETGECLPGVFSSDCNANQIEDSCEVPGRDPLPSNDCNANGLHDCVDLHNGFSEDCDGDETPDECQVSQLFMDQSAPLSPIGDGTPQSHVITQPPEAVGDVLLSFEAVGDLMAPLEFIDVLLNGTEIGTLFTGKANDCPANPDQDQIVLSAAEFNQIVAGQDALIDMVASSAVDGALCESFISVTIEYQTASAEDCNGNGVPDACDIFFGTSQDADENGVPDECQDCVPGQTDFSESSGTLSPIGSGSPQSYVVVDPPQAEGEVLLSFTASADLASSDELIDVSINGMCLGQIFVTGASDCGNPPDEDELVIPMSTYNSLIAGGQNAVITLTSSNTVNAALCGGSSSITVTIEYLIEQEFAESSGELSPISGAFPQSYLLVDPPLAAQDVLLDFNAYADLGASNEWIDVTINSSFVGQVFTLNAADCPVVPNTDQLVIPMSTFNDLIKTGLDALIGMNPTNQVGEPCIGSFITVTITYGTTTGCQQCPDPNDDGVVDIDDLLDLIAQWGPCPGCPTDFDADGEVEIDDLLILLGAWGPCP